MKPDARRTKAARAIATGSSQARAAREVGVNRSTIARWLEQADFQDLVREQQELLEAPAPLEAQAKKGLSSKVDKALDVIEEALSGGNVSAAMARVALDVVRTAATLQTAEVTQGESSLAAIVEALDARGVGSD